MSVAVRTSLAIEDIGAKGIYVNIDILGVCAIGLVIGLNSLDAVRYILFIFVKYIKLLDLI